jgi:ferredoxin-NADP reductase
MAVELTARLEEVVAHAADLRSLFLRLPVCLDFRPGQFVSCRLPVNGDTLIRPYSIASPPEDGDRLEILLDLVAGGRGSRYLFGLAPGAAVQLTGPWGTFTLDGPPTAETVFVADGTGIAPIRPMVRRALASTDGPPLHLLHAAASESRLVYRAEFERLAREHTRFRFEWLPRAALAAEVTRRYVTDDGDRSRHFYICGIGPVVHALRDALRQAGYARRAVSYERW